MLASIRVFLGLSIVTFILLSLTLVGGAAASTADPCDKKIRGVEGTASSSCGREPSCKGCDLDDPPDGISDEKEDLGEDAKQNWEYNCERECNKLSTKEYTCSRKNEGKARDAQCKGDSSGSRLEAKTTSTCECMGEKTI